MIRKGKLFKIKDIYNVTTLLNSNKEGFIPHNVICSICLDKNVNSLLLPCRHYTLCKVCVKEMLMSRSKCPICRNEIKKIIRIYKK